MRHLIEEATHIATSSVYADITYYPDTEPNHLSDLFPWGGYCADHGYEGNCHYPQSLVVLKTHFPAFSGSPFDNLPRTKTICLVRHPLDAFYSYFTHGKFPPYPETIPKYNLMHYCGVWKFFHLYWSQQEEVLTVRYEDLLESPKKVLGEVLKYIGYAATEEDIARAVAKHPPRGFPLKHLDFYTESDHLFIKEELHFLLERFHYAIPSDCPSKHLSS